MDKENPFGARSYVQAVLLLEPLYHEQTDMWEVLRAEREHIARYFREIGQELIIDEAEGYAFLRQIEVDGAERVPRIGRRQSLGYTATLLLVCLREELLRFDAAPDESTRLVRTKNQLRDLVGQFLRETNNQIRDTRIIDAAISRVAELGFIRSFGPADSEMFEVMRILKARIGPSELEGIKERLSRHVGRP